MKQASPKLHDLLKALADPTRMRILMLLGTGEVCVCHIHTALGVPQPTASRHLASLKRAGLVEARKIGLWVHYRLRPLSDQRLQAVIDAACNAAGETKAVSQDCCRLTEAIRVIRSPLQEQTKGGRAENHDRGVHA
jgi:ArsR family transcriptional regulator, arsenate/arsenite/antimonite-responsive transcriptional repressor